MTTDFKADGGLKGERSDAAGVRVVAILPFWRYAVGPTAAHSPAIPYYRLASAVAFFEEAKRDLPWAGVVLYKRRGLRGIEAVCEYTPHPLPANSLAS